MLYESISGDRVLLKNKINLFFSVESISVIDINESISFNLIFDFKKINASYEELHKMILSKIKKVFKELNIPKYEYILLSKQMKVLNDNTPYILKAPKALIVNFTEKEFREFKIKKIFLCKS